MPCKGLVTETSRQVNLRFLAMKMDIQKTKACSNTEINVGQPAFTSLESTMETAEGCVKYV